MGTEETKRIARPQREIAAQIARRYNDCVGLKDEIEAALHQARRAALDEAAWEADMRSVSSDGCPNERARSIAAAIRSLAAAPRAGDETRED